MNEASHCKEIVGWAPGRPSPVAGESPGGRPMQLPPEVVMVAGKAIFSAAVPAGGNGVDIQYKVSVG